MTQNEQLILQATTPSQGLRVYSEQQPRASLVPTLHKNGRAELSVFSQRPASPQQIGASVAKLLVAFPSMSDEFFNLLAERIAKKGISADRLEYAIEHVLDNFTYKHLTIADIMSIDRKVDIMSYQEMVAECSKRGCTTNDFAPIRIGEEPKPFWVHKSDKMKFGLPEKI